MCWGALLGSAVGSVKEGDKGQPWGDPQDRTPHNSAGLCSFLLLFWVPWSTTGARVIPEEGTWGPSPGGDGLEQEEGATLPCPRGRGLPLGFGMCGCVWSR